MKNDLIVKQYAKLLKIPADWLHKLIKFESNYNPAAKNPYSTAKGLIQFIDSTAKSLGYLSSQDLINKLPDFKSQMQYAVYPYLKKFMPFKSEQSLYMAVFYPKYRNVPEDTLFPEHVRKVNKGINTPKDYIRKVYFHSGLKYYGKISAIAAIPVIGLIYLIVRGFNRGRQRKK